jgi:hypothetical protein
VASEVSRLKSLSGAHSQSQANLPAVRRSRDRWQPGRSRSRTLRLASIGRWMPPNGQTPVSRFCRHMGWRFLSAFNSQGVTTTVSTNFVVKLVARNEGLRYQDQFDVYRFNLRLHKGRWIVYLPGTKGEQFVPQELSDEEKNTILPRIEAYLQGRKYFGFFGRTYPVIFEREGPISPEIAEGRRRAAEFWKEREKRE